MKHSKVRHDSHTHAFCLCSLCWTYACALCLAPAAHPISIPAPRSPTKTSKSTPAMHYPILTDQEADTIGKKIWLNEAGGSIDKLTWWGVNEEFASLGIGHFIWYPAKTPVTFTQTFPHVLLFLRQHGARLPAWLDKKPLQPCPWPTRTAFLQDLNSQRMKELRTLLASTIALQTRFIVQRLQQVLPALLATVSTNNRPHIQTQFQRMLSSNQGLYALIDYINFKGEGTNTKERYAGKGWGLKHVLLGMQGTARGKPALKEFARAAKQVLSQRVAHAPAERHEERWLAGWLKRCDSYVA